MGYAKYVGKLYKNLDESRRDEAFKKLWVERKKKWRRGPAVARHDKPIRIDRARSYGYKDKQGFIVVRVRVRRGGLRKSRPTRGRKPRRMGVNKITAGKSIQRIGEDRIQRKHPNLEVLGSYWLAEDGKYKWFEAVLVDPSHPAIKKDGDVKWIASGKHRKRTTRGLTPAGKKNRGQMNKGKGAEKIRPSIRKDGRGK